MRFHTALKLLALTFVFAFLSAGIVRGQQVNGSISGTVVDQSGAAVPGAQVQATNTATNAVSTTMSGSSGSFLLANLSVGSYDVKVTRSGFKSQVSTGVAVTA